jgi:exonuclease III
MEKLNFLTWNINNNKTPEFLELLNAIVKHHNIHILILQECFGVNLNNLKDYSEIDSLETSNAVKVFVNNSLNTSNNSYSLSLNDKVLQTQLEINNQFSFNLIAVHLYSKVKRDKEQQMARNASFPNLIKELERKTKHNRTVIVGDFNYSPFDSSLNLDEFIRSSSSKELIRLLRENKPRTPFFYNPMWNFLGDYDFNKKIFTTPGTIYWHNKKEGPKYYWHIFDGVLVRDEIMDALNLEDIKILKDFGEAKFVNITLNKQNQKEYEVSPSDHLPVLFSLNTNNLRR